MSLERLFLRKKTLKIINTSRYKTKYVYKMGKIIMNLNFKKLIRVTKNPKNMIF